MTRPPAGGGAAALYRRPARRQHGAMRLPLLLALAALAAPGPARAAKVTAALARPVEATLDEAGAARFAALALACVHREYPNKLSHVLASDADARPPRQLTPAFYGCFDWHSSVHGHWLLARLVRAFPAAPFAAEARAALATSLTPASVAAEVAYLGGPGRASFERPYGLAWLLQLAAELRTSPDAGLRELAGTLAPLELAAVGRISDWLAKLRYPIRSGEHSQTAFAFGLIRDWAVVAGERAFVERLDARIRAFYEKDVSCPVAYEPSGEDFLSPCLAEADLLRRILPPQRYAAWLRLFMPTIPRLPFKAWMGPAQVTDRSDPKLAHLDGLNLSRAWMLLGMASGLPPDDDRQGVLLATASAHHVGTLPAVTGEHYEGGHWLGTFAVYLTTGAGRGAASPR
jgi:DUF2891 family protein